MSSTPSNWPRYCWAAEINNYPERTIFQTPAWLSFIAKTQNAQPVFAAFREGQQGLGYFTGLMVCKFGIRILGSPFPGPGFASGRSVPGRAGAVGAARGGAGGQGRRGRWKRAFEFPILSPGPLRVAPSCPPPRTQSHRRPVQTTPARDVDVTSALQESEAG